MPDDELIPVDNEDDAPAPDEEPEAPEKPPASDEALARYEALSADLRRSVGRIQSLEAKLAKVAERDDSEGQRKIIAEVNKQYGGVNDLLESLVSGLDETAIDPAMKRRILEAAETSRRATEKASLRDEILSELRPQSKQEPVSQALPAGLEPEVLRDYEAEVVDTLQDAGLDPDKDFDWNGASVILARGGTRRELMKYTRDQIKSRQSDTRRQAAKTNAGQGSPNGSGAAAATLAERLERSDDLDEQVKILRAAGINV